MTAPAANPNHPEDAEITFLTGTYELLRGNPVLDAEVVELDLGCGSGSYTCQLAARYPERSILAADVMIGRLRKVVKRARREGLGNLRCFRTEARHLVALALPDGSLDRIHLLCPDPWPKDRHRGHRLMASDFTAQLHRVLKENGVFHFSSDDVPYFDAVKKVLTECRLFVEIPNDPELADIRSDFELRWLGEGKGVRHMSWRRLPLPPHAGGH